MPIPEKNTVDAPKSAKMRVFEELKEWIIDGTLQPGEKLSDTEIARYFSVSRTPVREAFQMLAEQKLIEVFPGRESRVSPLDIVNISQTYRMLAEMQALAVSFAFDKVDRKAIDAMRSANEKFCRAVELRDAKGCRAFDEEFHGVLISLADNAFLRKICDTLNDHISRVEAQYFANTWGSYESGKDHEQIIEALEAKELERTLELMRKNWLHTLDLIGQDI